MSEAPREAGTRTAAPPVRWRNGHSWTNRVPLRDAEPVVSKPRFPVTTGRSTRQAAPGAQTATDLHAQGQLGSSIPQGSLPLSPPNEGPPSPPRRKLTQHAHSPTSCRGHPGLVDETPAQPAPRTPQKLLPLLTERWPAPPLGHRAFIGVLVFVVYWATPTQSTRTRQGGTRPGSNRIDIHQPPDRGGSR